MGLIVTGGASLKCSFGVAPSVLMVLPTNKVSVSLFVATIMDNKPFVNIMPFGMCTTLSSRRGRRHRGSPGRVDTHALRAGHGCALDPRKTHRPGGFIPGIDGFERSHVYMGRGDQGHHGRAIQGTALTRACCSRQNIVAASFGRFF